MSELIFITGASGFIGSQTAKSVLQAGYRIRLSIRQKEQEQELRDILKDASQDKIEFAHIPDLTTPGAFEEALEGVDYVFHLASPMPGKGEDFREDYVKPAVSGSLAILQEALKHEQIKFVVVTSSILALIPLGGLSDSSAPIKANTGEKLPVSADMKFPDGAAGHGAKYSASKILAHQATRDFVEKEKPEYKLVTFHPVLVIGESLVQKNFDQLDGMNQVLWSSLHSTQPTMPSTFVDVKQCAESHVNAVRNYEKLKNGTEYGLSSPAVAWNEVAKFVKQEFPQVQVKLDDGPSLSSKFEVDTEPADRDLKIQWRPVQDVVRDTLGQQQAFQKQSHL
ncbi:putative oxidoreductase [Cercospora beticola]|uniref:Putative oxidoreductase n=1 Tax=Cercospora beticola TaxID=122368 RepID=A0A2G5HLN2_CERBT|nr:putative oxidoreductase [Cercospora beticola]PIA93467.1 putative oxidoreductase [Cercospora beticola]WPB01273.1 hypothetical protein RHO25_005897 [Cercospora beticola]